jgi:hypothetical protein
MRVHHFAHATGEACAGAAETALHKLANQIIEDGLALTLPERFAEYASKRIVLMDSATRSFETAKREFRGFQTIIPDLLLTRHGSPLAVEIAVTHRCDPEKIEDFRRRGIPAVEIDLSGVDRDAVESVVAEAVMHGAPRCWLFHPDIDAAIVHMRRKESLEKKAAERRAADEIAGKISAYRKGLDQLSGDQYPVWNEDDELHRARLSDHIGIRIDGYGCFHWPPARWQAAIFRGFLMPGITNYTSYRAFDIAEKMQKDGAVRKEFRFISNAMQDKIIAEGIAFLSPIHAIEAYLKLLLERNIVQNNRGYSLTSGVVRRIKELRALEERRRERLDDTRRRAERIVGHIPIAEGVAFEFSNWFRLHQEEFGVSFEAAIQSDSDRYDEMADQLHDIERMFFSGGGITEYELRLPIREERERLRDARQHAEVAREAERQARVVAEIAAARESQRRLLRSEAVRALGADADVWVYTGNPRLRGLAPVEAIRAEGMGLYAVQSELAAEARRRVEERRTDEMIANLRSQLREQADAVLGPAIAKLFLASPYPETNERSPVDFCTTSDRLRICLRLLQKVQRLRA